MSKKVRVGLLFGVLLTFVIGVFAVEAQDGRPTPTPIGQESVVGNAPNQSIRGAVYIDVNSDGVCVNSGVAGEVPVQYINIDFISSAGDKLATLQSGENGTYGFVNAGDSYWQVKADPDNTWIVTSENPLYVPIGADTPVQTDVNFCVQKVGSYVPPVNLPAGGSPPVLLPEAGGAATQSGSTALVLVAITGMGLILLGAGLKMRERATARQR